MVVIPLFLQSTVGLKGEVEATAAFAVWLEHLTGATMLEQFPDVSHYLKAWDELTAAALSPAASERFIRDLAEDIT
ncbi:hypothetical protein CAG99_18175 [Streptomyces marincola]|uniref:DUF5753 domain-containing protein n=1 Tax=Streptomyces marincola TaxID=2878388 RepID=A0A1W7D0I1_9ACTN|nr:hypothetical protein CAG99_18175 [Streptomyces marincola]